MEIYTEATSEATRDARKRLGDELSPHTPDLGPGDAPEPTEDRQSDAPASSQDDPSAE